MHTILCIFEHTVHTLIRLEPLAHSYVQTRTRSAAHSSLTRISAGAGLQRRWPGKALSLQ